MDVEINSTQAGFMEEEVALEVALNEITPQTGELTNCLDQ